MNLFSAFTNFYDKIAAIGNFFKNFFLLAIRLYWGWSLFTGGLQKLENIDKTSAFFESLGIPFAELSSYFVASLEIIGGLFLIIGFLSRLISIPLFLLMVIALITAHAEGAAQFFSDPHKFQIQPPVTFMLTILTIFCFGPGIFSIDYFARFLVKKNKVKR